MQRKVAPIFMALLLATFPVAAADGPPIAGQLLPDIRLPAPEDPAQRTYLGLSAGETFAVPEIRADVLVIEIFNMYCPHCQREAPKVNAFFRKVQKTPSLREKVRVIGIGAGNSPFEVAHFRKVYQVPFPLFPDPDYVIHRALGEVRTPYFIGVRPGQDHAARVFFSKLGGSKSAEKLLEELIDQAGLTKKGASLQ